MIRRISRRNALTTGAAATALTLGCRAQAPVAKYDDTKGPGREQSWRPGPDPSYTRDLTTGTTTVRLAGYLRGSSDMNVEERVKALRAQGLTACLTSPDPWIGMSDSEMREVRAVLEEHDVVVFEVAGYCNMLHTDEAKRQANLKRLARAIEAADKIGCRMVGTITGSRNPETEEYGDNYAVHPDNWTLETWKLTIAGIRQILDDTAGMQAALGMEAQVTTNLDGPLAHRRLMDDIGSDRVKVNLDPTNMCHLHNHFHTSALIDECFDLLGEDIYGCHAKDTFVLPHSQTVHVQEVCPGRGRMDYGLYLARLSRLEWSRSLLPEHIPADQFPEAYAYIRKVAAEVGVAIHGA